jgi:hypothetical protein
MARSGEVKRRIAEVTGVSLGAIEQLDRRLGSMGLLPRQRGRYGEHFEAIHIAYMLVGVLIMGDGIEHSGLSVVRALPKIANAKGELVERMTVGTAFSGERPSEWVGQRSSFMKIVEIILAELAQPPEKLEAVGYQVSALGLLFGNGAISGWLEAEDLKKGGLGGKGEFYHGAWEKVSAAAFKRKAYLERPALLKIADLLKPEAEARVVAR